MLVLLYVVTDIPADPAGYYCKFYAE